MLCAINELQVKQSTPLCQQKSRILLWVVSISVTKIQHKLDNRKEMRH